MIYRLTFVSFTILTTLQLSAAFSPLKKPLVSSALHSSLSRMHQDVAPSEGEDDKVMTASGIAGALPGLVLGGPLGAAVCGFGAALATQKDGATGDAARALGDVALEAQRKAIEFDKKHHTLDQTKQKAKEALEWAKEYDREHKVSNKVLRTAKELAIFSFESSKKFAEEHRVVEKGAELLGEGVKFVIEKSSEEITSGAKQGTPSISPAKPSRQNKKQKKSKQSVIDVSPVDLIPENTNIPVNDFLRMLQ